MGCGASSEKKNSPPPQHKQSVKGKDIKRRSSGGKNSARGGGAKGKGFMNSFALKFPVINKSFHAVFDSFQKFHTAGNGLKEQITADLAGTVLSQIAGDDKKFSDEELKELFHISDLDKTNTITFRQFLISVAVGYFLCDSVKNEDERFLEVQSGFKVVEQAFRDIDADGSGSIDVQEMKDALFFGHGANDAALLEARFKELDFNEDGDVELPEFMYAMVSW
eukprot:CAMPEP_0175090524 /NCGR_PEP_ID=MMETSP0086_2-20121207/1393_1 /TAXON_ID=136419 /ORGANISM="Unknown Unknown, Strain D1" /LENGTH=221 /DNA_ID=CAMNT_0016363161 /DNA_START=50 /DNA_END=712 /DNA_ORIENTATION=+